MRHEECLSSLKITIIIMTVFNSYINNHNNYIIDIITKFNFLPIQILTIFLFVVVKTNHCMRTYVVQILKMNLGKIMRTCDFTITAEW